MGDPLECEGCIVKDVSVVGEVLAIIGIRAGGDTGEEVEGLEEVTWFVFSEGCCRLFVIALGGELL